MKKKEMKKTRTLREVILKVGVQSVLRFRWAWSKIKFALVRLLGPFQEASY